MCTYEAKNPLFMIKPRDCYTWKMPLLTLNFVFSTIGLSASKTLLVSPKKEDLHLHKNLQIYFTIEISTHLAGKL